MARGQNEWVSRGSLEAGDEAFDRLRENLHPVTGQKLTPRTKEYREASYVEARKALVDKWRYEGKHARTLVMGSRKPPHHDASSG